MHPASFHAFVRKNGIHNPKNGPLRNWNTDLLVPVAKTASNAWSSFEESIVICRDDCFARFVKLLDNIRGDMNSENYEICVPRLSDAATNFLLSRH